MNDTSANGIHTPNGKFAAGNPGGPGNPHGGQVARLRAAMLEAVTPEDMRAVTRKLVEMALEGDLKAIDLLLNRTLGKADSGPLVAVQMNQQVDGLGEIRGRAAAIADRLRAERAERAARGIVEVPPTPEELERRKAEAMQILQRLR